MAATGRVKAWNDIFKKNTILPVAFDRQQRESSKCLPFNITIKSVDGIKTKNGDDEYQIRLSLFDLAYKQFFGRVWTSPPLQTKKDGQSRVKVMANQNVYFHTSLNDDSIAIVVEVLASYRGPSGTQEVRVCGWNLSRIFKYEGRMVDVSSTSSAPTQKLILYHGSPLALVYLDEPVEASSLLTEIMGCHVQYTLRTHQALSKAMHLVPENCILGGNDTVPGLSESSRDSKAPVPDLLKKPRLLKAFPCRIEKVSISFNTTIEKIEEDICRLLNEDRLSRENKAPGGTSLQIVKRQLSVGVHNGWMYVAEPETVNLVAHDGSSNVGFKRTASKRGHKRTPSTSSVGQANTLVHKNRIELDGMVEDPTCTVVFTLIYEVAQSVSPKDRKMSLAQAAFPVAVRWAAWCPLANLGAQEQTVQLVGGPGPNPEEMMVLPSPAGDSIGSSVSMSGMSGGTVTFSFFNEKKEKENLPVTFTDSSSHMLQLPPGSARAVSRASIQTEASSVLQEVQVTGRPPIAPSGRPGTGQSHHEQLMVPPLQGMGGSPPQTGYMSGMYPQGSPMGPYGMPLPYSTTPRGYMPVEIQHLRESGGSALGSAHMGMGPDLQELPFTPVHAPIMAVAPGMQSGQALSRAAYAKLYTAGFQPILDRHGEAAEVVDPNDIINFVAAKEDMDRLRANEVHLQFLAYARTPVFEAPGTTKQPSTIFFTFQFYRYPQVTTERLLLGNPETQLGTDPQAVPCLLQKLDKDGSVMKGAPGYMLKYMVDPAYLKPGEGRLFVHHMSQQILHIDVWDGDTLHLIGSCAMELKHLCRQGREAVQVTYELDIISQDIIDPEGAVPAGDMARDGTMLPTTLNQSVKGRLHLRMANIGHLSDTKIPRADALALTQKAVKMLVKSELGSSFLGGSLNAVNSEVKNLATTKIAKAAHVADTNHELAQVLFSKRDKAKQEETGREGGVDKKRKMTRMDAVRQTMGSTEKQTISSFRLEKEDRYRDLQTIEMYRHQTKRDGILNMLNKAISTEHIIHPALGVVEFFEFELRNPYNVEHSVIVETNDPELIVITDPREWRHFKMMNEIYTSVEEGMFNTESKSGKPEIFLRPKESVHVPFKFLTFKADHTVQPQTPSDPYKPQTKRGIFQKKSQQDPMETRVVKVVFRTFEDKPIGILSVKVEPQPHIIDQTFRFHHPEQSFLKKSIRLPPLHTLPGFPIGGAGLEQVWVKCSDNNVICTARKVQPGEPHDIFLKVACGASPQVKKFFMAIYTDPFLSRPIQIWQFYTHAMQRVDVNCTEGQTSRFTLLLRGTQASRLVQCHPSHANEMQITPKDPFMLAANTLQEVYVGVRPMQAGSKFLFINVVDIEYHQLVRSWLVCVTCQAPHVVKAYEISIPVGGGKSSNKKISYTNPYPSKKVFFLRTNREDLLQFKDTRLEVGGGETTTIGLKFAPSMCAGSIEILVFINDEDDKNEETFCVKANYQ